MGEKLQDHPRICGEKAPAGESLTALLGSPPHMRGKVLKVAAYSLCKGITPAYAGKSSDLHQGRRSGWDHPHMCGEKFYVDEVLPGDTGSPPHVRGKVLRCLRFPTRKDHPRICGEKKLSS